MFFYDTSRAATDTATDSSSTIIPDVEEISVCCLPAGTKITLANGTGQNIESLREGAKILSYNFEKQKFAESKVTKKIVKIREGVYEINKGLINITDDHPIYVRKSDGRIGWAAIDPTKSRLTYGYRNPMPLEIGDEILTLDKRWIKIESITFKAGPIKTYTFTVNSIYHNYFANNLLVSNALATCDEDNIPYIIDGDYYKPPATLTITINPDPPMERAYLTIESVGADILQVQVVESQIDLFGIKLDLTKVGQYEWRCMVPSNTAGKWIYISAHTLNKTAYGTLKAEIVENPSPPEKFELTLDTTPYGFALDVFKLKPQPAEFITPTDGKVHALYENGTIVYITASATYDKYSFQYWTGTDIENTVATNPLKIIMDKDREYVAYYSEEKIEPQLSFYPESHSFNIIKGESNSTTFQIWNSGTGLLTYSLTSDKNWLEVTPSSGDSSGEKDTITITVETADLDPGTYTANVSIICDNGETGIFEVFLYLSSTPSQKSIKLISPNGGESWQIGGAYEIRWSFTGNIGERVKIELYREDTLYKILSSNASNTGKCLWVISTDIPPGYSYKIKITSLQNETIYDFSDGIFSLFALSSIHFLYLSSPPACYETQFFSVSVFDENGNPVKDAIVSLYGQSIRTKEDGAISSPLKAPSVDKDTQVFIIASKPGYIYATGSLLVRDVENLIKIDAPNKVKEGENFTISVAFYDILYSDSPSYVVLDAEVNFNNETKDVNEFGNVKFRAPKVEENKKLSITVYVPLFDAYTSATIMVEDADNIAIFGPIKKVFTENWLIVLSALLVTLIIIFILLQSKGKSKKINIIAPVHVGSNEEFIVRVKDNKDRGIPDALVEFNGVTKKTNSQGIVEFKVPDLPDIKELYITATKENVSESIPIMVGSISKQKETPPQVAPPSGASQKEIQVFSPVEKKKTLPQSMKAMQTEDTKELPKIATASNEIIYRLIDAVLERHKRK
jgi:hypothetical protein